MGQKGSSPCLPVSHSVSFANLLVGKLTEFCTLSEIQDALGHRTKRSSAALSSSSAFQDSVTTVPQPTGYFCEEISAFLSIQQYRDTVGQDGGEKGREGEKEIYIYTERERERERETSTFVTFTLLLPNFYSQLFRYKIFPFQLDINTIPMLLANIHRCSTADGLISNVNITIAFESFHVDCPLLLLRRIDPLITQYIPPVYLAASTSIIRITIVFENGQLSRLSFFSNPFNWRTTGNVQEKGGTQRAIRNRGGTRPVEISLDTTSGAEWTA